MATAQTIIDRAARLIGAVSSGESPTTDESADCLTALNAMVDSWNTDRLVIYALADVTKTLTSNDGSYTIGSGGDINTTRPLRIEGAYVTDSGTDVPVEVVDSNAWDSIPLKTTTANYPSLLYYEPAYPLGIVHLWPVPTSTDVLTLSVLSQLSSFATVGTSVSLPPGYERALAYNLAIEIAPEFGRPVPAEVAKIARDSLASIKRVNHKPPMLQIEFAEGRRSNILIGV